MSRPVLSAFRCSLFVFVCGWTSFVAAGDGSPDGVWNQVGAAEFESRRDPGLTPWIQPQRRQAVRLSAAPLAGILDQAPMEFSGDAKGRQVVLSLPTPDGRFEAFEIVVSAWSISVDQ